MRFFQAQTSVNASETIKAKIGGYKYRVELITVDKRIFVKFGFNRSLINIVKSMKGARWHGFEDPPRKIWSIDNCKRNHFQLAHLQGQNPYAPYDEVIKSQTYIRPLYTHQRIAADFILNRHYCELAADCGVGKTLAAIEVAERVKPKQPWWIAPKSAIFGVQREMRIWDCNIDFKFMTYQRLVKIINDWTLDDLIPQLLVLDEASRIKNPTAQRSQAAMITADMVRKAWGDEGYVVCLSGSPAPKSPLDWYHQSEVCCPGFLREGSQGKLRQTLCITEKQDSPYGGSFYQLVSWRDDERKCNICGEFADHEIHNSRYDDPEQMADHEFVASINEVVRLGKRLDGLVLVQKKEDCLDLPDKIFRQIELKPSDELLRAARVILESAPTTIQGLTWLRELSDGFQYDNVPDGEKVCNVCNGSKRMLNPLYNPDVICTECEHVCGFTNPEDCLKIKETQSTICDGCGGTGIKKQYRRIVTEVECPKDAALVELLDEYSEVGRVVIYGGFQGTIDRIIKILEANKWNWIRADGRGWSSDIEGDHLDNFQDNLISIPRMGFIGQPGAAGMGITLTASPVIIYFSNDFNAESRLQSMERVHRPGMDLNLGCTIIDLLHLPPDYLVLDNLDEKQKLQSLTLDSIKETFDSV